MPFNWRSLFGKAKAEPAPPPVTAETPPPAAATPSVPKGVQTFQPPWSGDEEILANLAIGHLRENLIRVLKNEHGVHAETLMVLIGCVAGHSATQAAFAAMADRSGPALMSAQVADGATYYFGDGLNRFLVPEDPATPALWSFIIAAARQAGVPQAELPDPGEFFAHATRTLGSPEYGVLRISDDHRPQWQPRETLDAFWPFARQFLAYTDGPVPGNRALAVRYWPTVAAIVAQQLLTMTKDVLDPRLSLRIIMESAVTMSKVDPKLVPQEMPKRTT